MRAAPRQRYAATVRWAHWLTVLAVAAAYLLVELGDDDEHGGSAGTAMQAHYLAGLVVLGLLLVRVLGMALGPRPPIVPAPGPLSVLAARVMHLALYLFLLAQPVLGILAVNYAGGTVTLPWSGMSLLALVHADPGAREFVEELHESLGEILYGVIGLHVAAALWHHFVKGDNTLRRML
ncbi:MAG: cytochrome b/b6 domain-containing protein [Xanthomonadaceae bacterium]|nr:cytochrome b/b6 domain-containing protein [Xanthomonadaceae bacterium]MDE1965576.1 cytochrome b [Xanthomonadaceae bacterium]